MKTNIRFKERYINDGTYGWLYLYGPEEEDETLKTLAGCYHMTWLDADIYSASPSTPDCHTMMERYDKTDNITAAWAYWCHLKDME